MRFFTTTAITLILVLGSYCVQAATYYISTAGNDNNIGSSATKAWASIAKVNATIFYPGDSILFEGGSTFPGSLLFYLNAKGTAEKPIVVGSFGNNRATITSGTAAGIILYNTAGFKIEDLIFIGSGQETNTTIGVNVYMDLPKTRLSYIYIDNVEASGYREAGIGVGSGNGTSGFDNVSITNCSTHTNGDKGINIYASPFKIGHKNVYVANCKAFDNSGIPTRTNIHSGSGIVMSGVDGGIIEYSEAYNNGWLNAWKSGGPVGIWGYMCNNLIIQRNESHHNRTGTAKDGGGFDIDGGSTNSIMQYNYSHDNEGAGYLLAQFDNAPAMENIIIRYNISENDGRKNNYGAIHLWSTTKGAQPIKNAQIYNNTIYQSKSAQGNPKAVWVQAGGATQATFRNNIFVTTGEALVQVDVPANIRFEGNNYWSSGVKPSFRWGTTTYDSLPKWQMATGQEQRDGVSVGYFLDPKLKSPGKGVTVANSHALYTLKGYELEKGSAMVGKALDLKRDYKLETGESDFWGNSITQRNDLCIGANQLTDNSKACLQGGMLPLTFGQATGGIYSGSGVQEGVWINPLAAGVGNHPLRYTYTDAAGQTHTQHHTVTISDASSSEWTGGAGSSAWLESDNWSTCIPTTKIDVHIPGSQDASTSIPTIKTGEHAYARNLSAAGPVSIEDEGSLEISGKLMVANLQAAPHSNIIFYGEASQAIPHGTYGNLLLKGTGKKTLAGDVTVVNMLDLDQVKLFLGNHDLNLTSSGSVSNYTQSSYIVTDGTGQLTFQGIGPGITKVFPVGTAGSFAPVRLQNDGVTDNFGIRVEEGFKTYTPEGGIAVEGAVNKTWHITEETAGGSSASLNLQWNISDELPNFKRDASYISHFEDGEWDVVENSIGTVSKGIIPNTYSINIKGVTSFSPFAVASIQSMPVPLPVSLVSFKAKQQGFDVVLEWATASEQNNMGFEVEVAENGEPFRNIGFLKSHSPNSQMMQRYTFREAGIREVGTRHYRLRQIDFDGTITYSAVQTIEFNKSDLLASAYPNPFSDIVTLELEALDRQVMLVIVTDAQGKEILRESIPVQKGLLRLPINLSKVPNKSVCFMTAMYNNKAHHYKLLRN